MGVDVSGHGAVFAIRQRRAGATSPRSRNAIQNRPGIGSLVMAILASSSEAAARAGEHDGDRPGVRQETAARPPAAARRIHGSTLDGRDARNHGRGRWRVVEIRWRQIGRPGARRENPGIEGSAENDGHAAPHAFRQQLGQRRLIGERVAAGQQNHVELGVTKRLHADGYVIDADAEGVDRARGLELRQRRQAGVQQHPEVPVEFVAMRRAIEVMDVDHVDALEPEPPPAVGERTQDAIAAVVVVLNERRQVDVAVLRRRRVRHGGAAAVRPWSRA